MSTPREEMGRPIEQSLLERVKMGVRYMISGVTPMTWMGPHQPLPPQRQETEGRAFDYPVGYNLRITPREGEAVGFPQLRALADAYDLLRLVIETRKDQIESYEWDIVPRDEFKRKPKKAKPKKKPPPFIAGDADNGDEAFADQRMREDAERRMRALRGEPEPEEGDEEQPPPEGLEEEPEEEEEEEESSTEIPDEVQREIDRVRDFMLFPDKEHSWSQWLRMMLEDLLVCDTICVYPRATKGGGLYALELVDPATIKRVIDETGRTPVPPNVAYQQVLKGVPASDFTRDDLLYMMRNPRTWKLYGCSPVEQIITTVNIALRRQMSQLEFYTAGNIPEAIAQVPDTWGPKQIAEFQTWWDGIMEGNTRERRKMRFVPSLENIVFPKEGLVQDTMDEWLARIVCFAFSISPNSLIKQVNRATAQTVAEEAKAEGLMPLLTWFEGFLNLMIWKFLDADRVKFSWQTRKALSPAAQAQIDIAYLGAKVVTPDEVRVDSLGMDPLTPEERDAAFPKEPPPNPFGGFGGGFPPGGGAPGGGPPGGGSPFDNNGPGDDEGAAEEEEQEDEERKAARREGERGKSRPFG